MLVTDTPIASLIPGVPYPDGPGVSGLLQLLGISIDHLHLARLNLTFDSGPSKWTSPTTSSPSHSPSPAASASPLPPIFHACLHQCLPLALDLAQGQALDLGTIIKQSSRGLWCCCCSNGPTQLPPTSSPAPSRLSFISLYPHTGSHRVVNPPTRSQHLPSVAPSHKHRSRSDAQVLVTQTISNCRVSMLYPHH